MSASESVNFIREASPFIRAHRGRVFVIYFDGAIAKQADFDQLLDDIALLAGLGIQIVIVHGCVPQLEELTGGGAEDFVEGIRITNAQTMASVVQAASSVRVSIEARFSKTHLDTNERVSKLSVASANFVSAKPLGIVGGVDVGLAGAVRRIDGQAISKRLEDGDIVLISPLGYSSSGEILNLDSLELASSIATEIAAHKLVLLTDQVVAGEGAKASLSQLTVQQASALAFEDPGLGKRFQVAARACQHGVQRAHIVSSSEDGALLKELFTRDGSGTLISNAPFDHMRTANVDDISGILALIEPLESSGALVKRSREKLELEIDHFTILIREGTIVASGALYPFNGDGTAEVACVAVHPDYQSHGFGSAILDALQATARRAGLKSTFALTTQAPQWFEERGFERIAIDELPIERRRLYNYQRNSIVMQKSVD